MMVVLEVPSGILADRIGHLRTYRIAKGFDMLNFGLLVWAPSAEVMLLASAFGGIGRALGSGCLEAWFVNQRDLTLISHTTKSALSQANVWLLTGLGLGAAIGGGLASFVPQTPVAEVFEANPYKAALFLSLLIHCAAFLLSFASFHEGENYQQLWVNREDAGPNLFQRNGIARLRTFCSGKIVVLLCWQLLFGYTLANHSIYWQPVLSTLQGGGAVLSWIGLILASNYLVAAMLGHLCRRMLTKASAPVCLLLLSLLAGLSLVGLSVVNHVMYLIIVCWLLISAVFLSRPVIAAELHLHARPSFRSAAVSSLSFSLNAGGMMAGMILSVLTVHWSVTAAWLLNGFLVSGLAFGLYLKHRRMNSAVPIDMAEIS
ncbi:hypothetical protein [Photobacterium sp. 1_MG-2023]|uniref:hypothetical protein n=1 Tax=Photobacterium sp. 1_MG-2023 TaxID=3062646 RepID=UPI0026E1A32C|nr:hypothetical protein [Photobacterium sp. 1_MG-2023]MDO6706929.1 hypothetical protein [Photobacterium sp. 1_MG-2023]